MRHLLPEQPREAGIEVEVPDQSHIEGAELLANEARPILRKKGFTDEEIDDWALTYISEIQSGDVESFLDWISRVESSS